MRKSFSFKPDNIKYFQKQLLYWSSKFENSVFLNSNDFKENHSYNSYSSLFAIGANKKLISNENSFEKLKSLFEEKKDWLFGYFSYDLKNEIENLQSNNFDGINAPNLYFFIPEYVFIFSNDEVDIKYLNGRINEVINEIQSIEIEKSEEEFNIEIKSKIKKEEYLEAIKNLKKHIQRGDIYEANFCIEHYAESVSIDPMHVYLKLNNLSPTPYSSYFKMDEIYLMSSSPERYLKKIGNRIISQPIKGTIKRGRTSEEDALNKEKLRNDIKERSENIMIVDLVRNDLSITAASKSVKVEELCGIYTFPQVHQMISTVVSELSPKHHFLDTIKYSFPMGSMTGAPKIRAMELIEDYEKTKRGIYSGSVGYICPDGDFDFNVIIRSILYNNSRKYLSFITGGAITIKSIPENEYDECLLKAEAMYKILST